MITPRTWTIAGAAAALILVPAGVAYAVTAATDDTPPAFMEREQARDQLRMDRQGVGGFAIGPMHRDADDRQGGEQMRDQMREHMRDADHCDGEGPWGDGPRTGDDDWRGGMMGGRPE